MGLILALVAFIPFFVVVLHGKHRNPVKFCACLGISRYLPSLGFTSLLHNSQVPLYLFLIFISYLVMGLPPFLFVSFFQVLIHQKNYTYYYCNIMRQTS